MLKIIMKYIILIQIIFLTIYNCYYYHYNRSNNFEAKDDYYDKDNDSDNDKDMETIKNDGFIIIDSIKISKTQIYFGYYEDSFLELKIYNGDAIDSISFIDYWDELQQTYNMNDIMRFNTFNLFWINDCISEYGKLILVNFKDTQSYGNTKIWLCDINNKSIQEFDYLDWWIEDSLYVTRESHETITIDISFLDINETFSFYNDEPALYLDYLGIPLNRRVIYDNIYFNTVGCQVNDDSIVITYRFRTGTCDWIPDLEVTLMLVNDVLSIKDANLYSQH